MRLGDFSALTFDCYGTLIDWEAGILAALHPWRAAHNVTVDDEALLAAFGRAESRREADQPATPYPQILAGVLEDLASERGTTASPAETQAFGGSVKDWPAFPDSAEALAYLQQHYKLVIVSNVDRESFRASNAKLGVTFDAIVTAEDAGAYKPAPNHFRLALARLAELGVDRERVLHVAQSLFHDHVPAKQLGLPTVWVNRRSNRPHPPGNIGTGPEGTGSAGPGGRSTGTGTGTGGTGTRGTAGSGGATPAPSVPVTPDLEIPTMAGLADLHRQEQAN